VISGFHIEAEENCSLLGYYAANSGNFLLTFRDNLSVPSSEVKILFILLIYFRPKFSDCDQVQDTRFVTLHMLLMPPKMEGNHFSKINPLFYLYSSKRLQLFQNFSLHEKFYFRRIMKLGCGQMSIQ